MLRIFFLLVISLIFYYQASAQKKAKAIAYSLEVDLQAYDPIYYELTESEDATVRMEIDVYYTESSLKTVNRIFSQPLDYEANWHQLFYNLKSQDEYLIDNKNKTILLKKRQVVYPQATGTKKKILGYKCKGFIFTNFEGTRILVYVASRLKSNICPLGNFSLAGTVLELITSNGIHYQATDFSEGELSTDFFDLPKTYKLESITIPPPAYRSK